jgi:Mg-chelatase subunit ChlD
VSFANPAGLFLLALAVPVLLLHILRPRRDPQQVSSVFLWQSLAAPVSAARPWQRLRPSVLLFLQLLAVILLALAVARPVKITDSPVADHTVFIVDASGSMAAHDGEPDRLADAKAEARDLRDEIPDGGMASIVVADTRPHTVLTASTDGSAFDDALGSIETTPGAADFGGAFALAEGLETTGAEIAFVLVSDGGLSDAEQRLLPPSTTYRAVGDDSTNRAITRLTVEPRGNGLFAVAALANTGGEKATQTLRLDVDGVTHYTEEVTLAAGEEKEVTVDLPGGERVEAFLEGEDLLDADDHLYAVAPRRGQIDVTIAVPGADHDPVLDYLFQAIPGADVTWVTGSQPAPGADLVVYDQVDVPDDPQAPFWAIAPPNGVPGNVEVTGTVDEPIATLLRTDDDLLSGLDLTEVVFLATQQVDAPAGETLLGTDTTPMLLRGRMGDRPFVYMGFSLLGGSTLPADVAFPVMADRIVSELAGAALPPGSVAIGDALPVDAARDNVVTGPGGNTVDVPAGAPAPHADRVGFWTIETDGQADRTLAVNPASGESDLQPAVSLLAPERTSRAGDELPRGQVSILKWAVLPLLALLALEWWISRRRQGVGRRQFRVATAARVLIALVLIGALLDLAWIRPEQRVATMFLVDASDSLGVAGQEEALDWVRTSISSMPDDDLAGVALLGGQPRLELTMQSDPVLGPATVEVDASRTNLAEAVRLAGAVLPSDAKRRVVLISDGRPTEGDVEDEARRLEEQGIPVDVQVVERAGGPDVAVSDVEVPNKARQGEDVTVTATVSADRAGPAVVTLLADGDELDSKQVDLEAGDNTVSFTVPAAAQGVERYQVKVASADDSVTQNDLGYGAVEVTGPPKVLLLEGRSGAGAGVVAALRQSGMGVDVLPVTEVPPLDELTTYKSILLADVNLDLLTSDQIEVLMTAVRDAGRGMVTLGGTQSYGLGNYLDSEFEQILPVVSDILDPKRRQTVSEVLAIDTSGSMAACHCSEGASNPGSGGRMGGGVNKTDIARAGAARAIEALSASDSVGILAVDTNEEWVLDLQQLPAQDVVTSGLRELQPTGTGTDLSRALTTAAEQLRESHTSLKHIILFTDGFVNEEGVYDELADQAEQLREDEGITTSVLATGEGAAEELEQIAIAGGGRFYPGRDLQEIPQLMQQEAVIASRDFITEGQFLPVVTSSSSVVRSLASTPPLLGYVATTAQPQASTHLRIGPDADPLLASWNVGLGRVSSWMSDGGERWSQGWVDWDGYVDFWSRAVGDTFPREATGQTLTTDIEDGVLQLRLEGSEDYADGAEATVRVVGPDGEVQDVRLERVGSRAFAGELPVTAAGSYSVVGSVDSGSDTGEAAQSSALTSLSYSPEYEPGAADPALLRRVSELTGGRGEISPDEAFDAANLAAGHSRVALARWFLLLAALLWPIAVALSRLVLRNGLLAQIRYSLAVVVWWLRTHIPALPGRAPTARPQAPLPPPPSSATAAGSAARPTRTFLARRLRPAATTEPTPAASASAGPASAPDGGTPTPGSPPASDPGAEVPSASGGSVTGAGGGATAAPGEPAAVTPDAGRRSQRKAAKAKARAERPARPERPQKLERTPDEDDHKREEKAAPAETLGSLLASQRRRRTGSDDPDDAA